MPFLEVSPRHSSTILPSFLLCNRVIFNFPPRDGKKRARRKKVAETTKKEKGKRKSRSRKKCKLTPSLSPHRTVASTTLFILAKRRQWHVRARLSRASRRLTGGRFGGCSSGGGSATPRPPPPAATTNHRRVTVTAGRFKAGHSTVGGNIPHIPVDSAPMGSKLEKCGVRTQVSSHRDPRGLGGEGRDLEKGDVPRLVDRERRGGRRERSWIRRLWGDGWK